MSEETPAASIGRGPVRFGGWLAGRASRTEYWIVVGAIIALGIGLGFAPRLEGVGRGLSIVIVFSQVRRLHDIGRTGWWAAAAVIVPVILMLPFIADPDLALLVGTLATLAPVVAIGVPKGQAFENRFGPPPPRTWKYMLTGR